MISISISAFVSCEEDVEDFTPPNYASFETGPVAISVNQGSSTSYEVHVYTANVTGAERSIPLNTTGETTLNAESYTLPDAVTIPANSNEGTFTVDFADNNLDNAGGKLVLSLNGVDANMLTGDPLTFGVQKVCPFDINNFVGDFAASEVFTAGTNEGYSFVGSAFPVSLAVNPADSTGNSLVLSDPNGIITDGTVLTFDLATGSFTIPDDTVIVGFPLAFSSSTTATCSQELSFTGDLGPYGEYTVTLKKQ